MFQQIVIIDKTGLQDWAIELLSKYSEKPIRIYHDIPASEEEAAKRFALLGMGILIQSWMAGLFLGKITTGSYTGGFMYSIFLVVVSIAAITLIQLKLFSVAAIYGG